MSTPFASIFQRTRQSTRKVPSHPHDVRDTDVLDDETGYKAGRSFHHKTDRTPQRRAGSGKSGNVRVIYVTRNAEGEIVLLTLYAKSTTDNLTGQKLKEIRHALEE